MSQSLLLSRAQLGTVPILRPVCQLASSCPSTHTHRGWDKGRTLPKTSQLEGCNLDSDPGLSTPQTCVLNHWALMVGS